MQYQPRRISDTTFQTILQGALSAGVVLTFLWAFAKNFEPVATKWFM